jgi:alkylation response protein AidB-like acyl-CoA dehydrogenase
MDLLLSEEEELIRNTAREILGKASPTSLVRAVESERRGYDADLWKVVADLGWIGLSVPESCGGQGEPLTLTGLVISEAGRALAPIPLLSTTVAALQVAHHGGRRVREEVLPLMLSGNHVSTFALHGLRGRVGVGALGVTARPDGDGYVLDGTSPFVDNLAIADSVLVAAKVDGGVVLALVDTAAAGLSRVDLVTTAKDSQGSLRLDAVSVPAHRVIRLGGVEVYEAVLDLAAALLCAQIAGATRRDMEYAVDYAKYRRTFGHPIGSYQAIQHMCADMLIGVDGADMLTFEAIWRLSEGLPASVEVSQAKSFVNETCLQVCRSSQQVHGGIGFMMEFDLQLWYRRVAAWTLRLGTSVEHRDRIARALLDSGVSPVRVGDPLSV